MRIQPPKKLFLIFDLDGTLMDTQEDLAESVNRTRADFGLPPLPVATIVGYVGNGVHKLLERALAGRAVDVADAAGRMSGHYARHMFDKTRLYPGVKSGLARLAASGCSMALISNKQYEPCAALLRHFGIFRFFSCVLGGDSVPNIKPHPEALFRAMTEMGASADRTWMTGDNYTDIEAAARAGVKSVFVSYGYGIYGETRPDVVCPSFLDVARHFLRELRA